MSTWEGSMCPHGRGQCAHMGGVNVSTWKGSMCPHGRGQCVHMEGGNISMWEESMRPHQHQPTSDTNCNLKAESRGVHRED